MHFLTNGYPWSVGFWLFNPSNVSATMAWGDALLDDVSFSVLDHLVPIQTVTTVVGVLRLSIPGLAIARMAGTGAGAYTGGQALSVTAGYSLRAGDEGRGSVSTVHLSGIADEFVLNNAILTHDAFTQLSLHGEALLNALNSLLAPDGSPEVAGVLHRRSSAGPLPVASFAPFVSVTPWQKVGSMRRRMPSVGAVSPS